MNKINFKKRILANLNDIYSYVLSSREINILAKKICTLKRDNNKKFKTKALSQNDVLLITYANTLTDKNKKSFKVLQNFLDNFIKKTFSIIHILPFNPSSSDGGFSVIDFLKVDKKHGNWTDISNLSKNYKIMVDLVLNHGSRESKWFKNFINDKGEGKDFYLYLDEFQKLSHVVRARSHKLLQKIETKKGIKYLWCTFSPDQIDFNYRNPQVLITFLKIIKFIMEKGPLVFRLDAVAFLWKRIDSDCVNLDQTHAIVRLIRTFVENINPNSLIITETNLPFHENLSYFGNSDEAQGIYNFTFAPLIINTLIKGDSSALNRWSMGIPPARKKNYYINFLATHDGIGLRPLEGMINDKDLRRLTDCLRAFGSKFTYRRQNKKSLIYEANISLIDALSGTVNGKDKLYLERYIAAHAILLSFEGIPAIYIHSLFGTRNDYKAYRNSKIKRSINRTTYNYPYLAAKLKHKESDTNIIFYKLLELIEIRKKQSAFHPNATQYTLDLGKQYFGIWRQSNNKKQSIFAVCNITNKSINLDLSKINLIKTENWYDLLSKKKVEIYKNHLIFKAYQTMWITNFS